MESIEKLRESSHLDDSKWTLETGEVINVYGSEPNDPNAVNWGEQWRNIADEIEREIAERYMQLPCDADGVPIRCGDKIHRTTSAVDNVVKVIGVSEREFFFNGPNFMEPGIKKNVCNAVRHVPRTIEDVLRDVWKEALDYSKSDMWRNPDEVFAERADEIRELMDVDDG